MCRDLCSFFSCHSCVNRASLSSKMCKNSEEHRGIERLKMGHVWCNREAAWTGYSGPERLDVLVSVWELTGSCLRLRTVEQRGADYRWTLLTDWPSDRWVATSSPALRATLQCSLWQLFHFTLPSVRRFHLLWSCVCLPQFFILFSLTVLNRGMRLRIYITNQCYGFAAKAV